MDIHEALSQSLQEGVAVRRITWKEDMFVFHTVADNVSKDFIPKFASLPKQVKDILVKQDKDVIFHSSITAYIDGQMNPGWVANEKDIDSYDWEVVQ